MRKYEHLTIGSPDDTCEKAANVAVAKALSGHDEEISGHYLSGHDVGVELTLAPKIVFDALAMPGCRLESGLRALMEPHFRRDFSNVRIHTDSYAAASARAIGASAYTVGADIFFGDGAYRPHTAGGLRLIAHELAHVAQYDDSRVMPVVRRQNLPTVQRAALPTAGELERGCPQRRFVEIPAEVHRPAARLAEPELATRITQVRTAISRAREAGFPVAADNLQHWLAGNGVNRWIAGDVFRRPDSGVMVHVVNEHLPRVREGACRRAAYPTNHAESLRTPGATQVIHWQDFMRASPTSAGATERDLSIALGGFQVLSLAVVRSTPQYHRFEIVRWYIQVGDRYNFNGNNQAVIPVPEAMITLGIIPRNILRCVGTPLNGFRMCLSPDNYFREIEASGGARSYFVYSEVFEAPAVIPRGI